MTFAVIVAGLAAMTAPAQAPSVPPTGVVDPSQMNQRFPDKTIMGASGLDGNSQELKRQRLMNVARQKAMLSDVDKMVKLAQQLNDEIAAPGSNLPPGERLRIAAEIEKLAKDVKEKMVFAQMAPSPNSNNPFGTWPR